MSTGWRKLAISCMSLTMNRNFPNRAFSDAMAARVIHLNHAGASPSPPSVTQRCFDHLELEAQVGGYRAQYDPAIQEELSQVYHHVAKLINSKYDTEIALVESATVAWTRAFYSLAQHCQLNTSTKNGKNASDRKKVILMSEAEYAANVVAACQWAKDQKQQGNDWTVLAIPSSQYNSNNKDGISRSTGMVDLKVFRDMLEGRYHYKKNVSIADQNESPSIPLDPSTIAMVCVTHIPTGSGIVNPVEEIGALIADFNEGRRQQLQRTSSSSPLPVYYIVDACQSVGQLPVDVQRIKCHATVATGRKFLRGPRGTGFLFMADEVTTQQQIMPHHLDHYGVPITPLSPSVDDDSTTITSGSLETPVESFLQYKPLIGARRFEFWESNIANRLGLGEAVRLAADAGLENIAAKIQKLAAYLYKQLQTMADHQNCIRLHHRGDSGIVTFWIDGMDARAVAQALWKPLQPSPSQENDLSASNEYLFCNFEVTVSPPTSTPLDTCRTAVPDLIRVSLQYTNTEADLDLFCGKLDRIIMDHHNRLNQ